MLQALINAHHNIYTYIIIIAQCDLNFVLKFGYYVHVTVFYTQAYSTLNLMYFVTP